MVTAIPCHPRRRPQYLLSHFCSPSRRDGLGEAGMLHSKIRNPQPSLASGVVATAPTFSRPSSPTLVRVRFLFQVFSDLVTMSCQRPTILPIFESSFGACRGSIRRYIMSREKSSLREACSSLLLPQIEYNASCKSILRKFYSVCLASCNKKDTYNPGPAVRIQIYLNVSITSTCLLTNLSISSRLTMVGS